MGQLLVTIGTDGVTDWVKMPDGQRHNLGLVSALNFVMSLAPARVAKGVLNAFVEDKSAMLAVDEERMWALLAPRRPRLANDVSSSMGSVSVCNREFTADAHQRTENMSTISDDLTAIERHIQALDEAVAKKATNLSSGAEHLVRLAGKIKSPNQSKNKTYYNLGAPKVFEVGDKVAGLSFDVYASNTDLAAQITTKAAETISTIERLASEGRRFNADRAKADVREVTTKVAGILKADLTASWVRADLDKLASRMGELHGLFAPKA